MGKIGDLQNRLCWPQETNTERNKSRDCDYNAEQAPLWSGGGGEMMTYTQLSNQEPYLIIHADGKITASEKMQPSETAARVLECMKTQWMEDSQSKQIRELQDRIKRLEKACGEMVSEEDTYIRLQTWLKAKEDKP